MRSNCWRGCWPPGERPSANPALPSDPSVCRMVLFSAREVGGEEDGKKARGRHLSTSETDT